MTTPNVVPGMDYATAASEAADPNFTGRVRAAVMAACARVGAGNFQDAHQKSVYLSLVWQVVHEPELYTETFAWVLTGYCKLGSACTDEELDTAIDQLWPAISGYMAGS